MILSIVIGKQVGGSHRGPHVSRGGSRVIEVEDELPIGESLTVADIVCAYDLGILAGAYDLKAYPSLHAYLSRLLARPAATSFAEAIGWS